MKRAIPSALFLILFSSAALFAQEGQKHAAAKSATVDIINAEGHSVGTAVLSESPHGVKIVLNVKNLPPGPHLMHIHQFAKCDTPDFQVSRTPLQSHRRRAQPYRYDGRRYP